jgi:hypothetical protein
MPCNSTYAKPLEHGREKKVNYDTYRTPGDRLQMEGYSKHLRCYNAKGGEKKGATHRPITVTIHQMEMEKGQKENLSRVENLK